MAGRRIYLVRHGETAGESSVRYHGTNDVPLDDVGRGHARALVPWLRRLRFAAVLYSPLARAAETARILSEALEAMPPRIAAVGGLREIHFGAIEGMTDAEIQAAHPDWHRTWRAAEHEGFPDGDTLAAFSARVQQAFDQIRAEYPGGDLLLVAHRGVIRTALQHLLGQDVPGVALGSLSVVWEGPPHHMLVHDEVPPPLAPGA